MSKGSFHAEAYMAQAALALGIELDDSWKPGVADNLKRAHQIAQSFLHFPLADDVEPASTFEP